jgi:CRISPR system Cascade subunit CasC
MLIEIHMLQNHSPSNLNRDDLGAPKSAMFAGTLRARISSQCLKRSIRWSPLFRQALDGFIGTRTVCFPELVREALRASTVPAEEHDRIVRACGRIARAEDKASRANEAASDREEDEAGTRTAQLIFLAPNEAAEFVRRLSNLRTSRPQDYARFLRTAEPKREKGEKMPLQRVLSGVARVLRPQRRGCGPIWPHDHIRRLP